MSKILLLEDDISLVDGLKYSLKKNGFDVEVARTVCEAIKYLAEISKYDLLILDVTLPDGTGFEAPLPPDSISDPSQFDAQAKAASKIATTSVCTIKRLSLTMQTTHTKPASALLKADQVPR